MIITASDLLKYHRSHIDCDDDDCYNHITANGARLWRQYKPQTFACSSLELDCETLERNINANREASLNDARVQQFLLQQQAHIQQFEAEIVSKGLKVVENPPVKVPMNY